jgi:hypothetical protein
MAATRELFGSKDPHERVDQFCTDIIDHMLANKSLVRQWSYGQVLSVFVTDLALLEVMAPGTVVAVRLPYPEREGNTAPLLLDHKEALKMFDDQEQFIASVERFVLDGMDEKAKSLFRNEHGHLNVKIEEVWAKLHTKYSQFTAADFANVSARMALPLNPATQTMEDYIDVHRKCITLLLLHKQAIPPADQIQRLIHGIVIGDPAYDRDVADFRNSNHPLTDATYTLCKAHFLTRAEVKRSDLTAQTAGFAARTAAPPASDDHDDSGGGGKYYFSHADFLAEAHAFAARGEPEYAYGAVGRDSDKLLTQFYCCSHGQNPTHGSAHCDRRPWKDHDVCITLANRARFPGAAINAPQPSGYWKGRDGRGSDFDPPQTKASGDWRNAASPGAAGRGGGGRGFGGRGAAGGGGGRGRGY